MATPRTHTSPTLDLSIRPTPGPTHRFDARRTVRAIAFHLVDQRIAWGVEQNSMLRAMDLLAARGLSLTVGGDEWAAMTNARRLQWLAEGSGIRWDVVAGGVAVLGEA